MRPAILVCTENNSTAWFRKKTNRCECSLQTCEYVHFIVHLLAHTMSHMTSQTTTLSTVFEQVYMTMYYNKKSSKNMTHLKQLMDYFSIVSILNALSMTGMYYELKMNTPALSAYRREKQYSSSSASDKNCSSYGYPAHANKKKCPAIGKSCIKCGKKGHFSRVCCQSSSNKNDGALAQTGQASSARIGSVLLACSNSREKLPRLLLSVGDGFVKSPQMINVVPDTGAEVTVVGETYLSQLGIKHARLNSPKHILKHVAGGNWQLHVIL